MGQESDEWVTANAARLRAHVFSRYVVKLSCVYFGVSVKSHECILSEKNCCCYVFLTGQLALLWCAVCTILLHLIFREPFTDMYFFGRNHFSTGHLV